MKTPWRLKIGTWLEQFTILHPLLRKYSHEYPEGQKHYINRVSTTFMNAKKTRKVTPND